MNFFSTRNFYLFTITIFVLLLTVRCIDDPVEPKNEITPEDDAIIGRTIDKALLHYIDTSSGISLLDQQHYPAVYTYIHQISQSINGSNSFLFLGLDPQGNSYDNNYTPTIRVIDQVGNSGAFVLPGGYIYLYKDFLQEINFEAQFAPILAHLMACSKNRYDIEKLEARFSTNFLLDLALGGTINNGSGSDISTILDALENEPYSTNIVNILDKEAEKTVCELGYDIQTYSDWFIQHKNGNVKWCHQFPRTLSLEDYASHLFYAVRDSLSCEGEVDEGGYPQFKSLLN
jgi:hypothetical protein